MNFKSALVIFRVLILTVIPISVTYTAYALEDKEYVGNAVSYSLRAHLQTEKEVDDLRKKYDHTFQHLKSLNAQPEPESLDEGDEESTKTTLEKQKEEVREELTQKKKDLEEALAKKKLVNASTLSGKTDDLPIIYIHNFNLSVPQFQGLREAPGSSSLLMNVGLIVRCSALCLEDISFGANAKGRAIDYYHIDVETVFQPQETGCFISAWGITRPVRMSSCSVEVVPVCLSKITDAISGYIKILQTSPLTTVGKTLAQSSINFGISGNVGIQTGIASVTPSLTIGYQRSFEIPDTSILNRSNLSSSHAKWRYQINNLAWSLDDTSLLSISNFSPDSQFILRVDKQDSDHVYGNHPTLSEAPLKKYFAFDINVQVGIANTIRWSTCCCSCLSTKRGAHVRESLSGLYTRRIYVEVPQNPGTISSV